MEQAQAVNIWRRKLLMLGFVHTCELFINTCSWIGGRLCQLPMCPRSWSLTHPLVSNFTHSAHAKHHMFTPNFTISGPHSLPIAYLFEMMSINYKEQGFGEMIPVGKHLPGALVSVLLL